MVLQVPEADPLTHADVNVVNVVDPCAVAGDTTVWLEQPICFTLNGATYLLYFKSFYIGIVRLGLVRLV